MGIKSWKEGRKGGRQMSEVADGRINREEGTSERRWRSADLAFELLPTSHLLLLLFL